MKKIKEIPELFKLLKQKFVSACASANGMYSIHGIVENATGNFRVALGSQGIKYVSSFFSLFYLELIFFSFRLKNHQDR